MSRTRDSRMNRAITMVKKARTRMPTILSTMRLRIRMMTMMVIMKRIVMVWPMTKIVTMTNMVRIRVAEVAREHGWHPPKSLDSDENFKPEHTLFCRELRFVAIYALFGDLWAKKVPFWVKNSISWARSALLNGI